MASSAQAKQFIQQIAPIIQEEAKKRGYHVCSPIIAQACLESAFGTSSLGYRWHNYFGMKCGSKWSGRSVNLSTKEEYTQGVLTSIRDNFRVYDDMDSGVAGYFDFINTSRYSNLKEATTPKQYLELIKADGYATSSTYVNSNLNYISRYGLERYDWIFHDEDEEVNPYKLTKRSLSIGCKGESVKWLQWQLNKNGVNLTIDGIYGKLTKLAVILYQKNHHDDNGRPLLADGIAGTRTLSSLKRKD